MAGQSCLNSYLCCFAIADFTYHYDVWVLTQERTQCVRERETDLWFYLNLIYAFQLIFDWVFDGQDFCVSSISDGVAKYKV